MPIGLLHYVYRDRVIIDEAHRIGNSDTFATACYKLRRKFCTLVTGGPHQIDFLDWYPLLYMMRRDYAGAFHVFLKREKHKKPEWSLLEKIAAIALGVVMRGMCVRRMNNSKFNGEYNLPRIVQYVERHEYKADDGTKYKHQTKQLGGLTEHQVTILAPCGRVGTWFLTQ
jgi:hypothetical protein